VLEDATRASSLQLLKEEEKRRGQPHRRAVERATSARFIRLVDSTIFTAIQRRASDIHIETADDAVYVK